MSTNHVVVHEEPSEAGVVFKSVKHYRHPGLDGLTIISDPLDADTVSMTLFGDVRPHSGPVHDSNLIDSSIAIWSDVKHVVVPTTDSIITVEAVEGVMKVVASISLRRTAIEVYIPHRKCFRSVITHKPRAVVVVNSKKPSSQSNDLFAEIAALGMSCGLETPREWYINWYLHAPQIERYEDIPKRLAAISAAFASVASMGSSDPGVIITGEMWHAECVEWYANRASS